MSSALLPVSPSLYTLDFLIPFVSSPKWTRMSATRCSVRRRKLAVSLWTRFQARSLQLALPLLLQRMPNLAARASGKTQEGVGATFFPPFFHAILCSITLQTRTFFEKKKRKKENNKLLPPFPVALLCKRSLMAGSFLPPPPLQATASSPRNRWPE
jgi:hypothetical protein